MSEQEQTTPSEQEQITPTGEGRKEGVKYEATQGEVVATEEFEKLTGKYDDDGFYVLEDGSFYDHNGYFFDEEGYDQFGGYYEDGVYVPGPEYEQEYYRKFEEQYGEELLPEEEEEDEFEYDLEDYFSEQDDDEYGDDESLEKKAANLVVSEPKLTEHERYKQELKERILQEDANRLIPISQHINPAIKWLEEQPQGKRFVLKIDGLPAQANISLLEKLIIKKLKDAGVQPIPETLTQQLKIVIDKDKFGHSLGVGYVTTAYRPALIELIKLHKKVWGKRQMKTFLSGFCYDNLEDYDQEEEVEDQKIEKWALKNPDYELMQYRKKGKKQQSQPTNPGSQEQVKAAKIGAGAGSEPAKKQKAKTQNTYNDSETVEEKKVQKKKEDTSQRVAPKKDADDDYGQEIVTKKKTEPKKVESKQADADIKPVEEKKAKLDDDYGSEVIQKKKKAK